MTEAQIIINGHQLTHGQAMTLRVAVGSFLVSLQNEGLGTDEQGKKLSGAYMDRAREIEAFLIS